MTKPDKIDAALQMLLDQGRITENIEERDGEMVVVYRVAETGIGVNWKKQRKRKRNERREDNR